jgi:hypothetical protein
MGESRYGAAATMAMATATEAMELIYGSVRARRSFEAAGTTLDMFNSPSVNVCVLSNGVLLERQYEATIITMPCVIKRAV